MEPFQTKFSEKSQNFQFHSGSVLNIDSLHVLSNANAIPNSFAKDDFRPSLKIGPSFSDLLPPKTLLRTKKNKKQAPFQTNFDTLYRESFPIITNHTKKVEIRELPRRIKHEKGHEKREHSPYKKLVKPWTMNNAPVVTGRVKQLTEPVKLNVKGKYFDL